MLIELILCQPIEMALMRKPVKFGYKMDMNNADFACERTGSSSRNRSEIKKRKGKSSLQKSRPRLRDEQRAAAAELSYTLEFTCF